MNSNQEGLIKQLAAAYSSHNVDQLCALFTENAFYEDVPSLVKATGQKELREFFTSIFQTSADFRMEIKNVLHGENFAAAEWIVHGTLVGDFGTVTIKEPKAYAQRIVSIIEFEENKIRRVSDYWDISLFFIDN